MKTSTATAVSSGGRGLRVAAALVLALGLTLGCAPSPGGAEGGGNWGVRAGAFVPGAASMSYSPSFTAGAFRRGNVPEGYGPGGLPFEIGFDVSASDSEDGRVETTFLAAHATALFPLGGPEQEAGPYLLGGYRGFIALSKIDGRSSHSALSAALDVGLGFGTAAGWDFRLTWSTLLSSDDLKDIAQITSAYRF